jgi:hypothetical protein
MSSRFHMFRAVVATGVSLWLAVLACLMGCTLPTLAGSDSANAPSIHEKSAEQSQPDLMAGMENCPHHSGSNSPSKPRDGRPTHGGGMSCCPVEVTVASKPVTATLPIAPARDLVLNASFNLKAVRFFTFAEFVPPLQRSGRDTLLETHLLRI